MCRLEQYFEQREGVVVHALVVEHDSHPSGGRCLFEFGEQVVETVGPVVLFSSVQIDVYGIIRQTGGRGRRGIAASRYSLKIEFFQDLESFCAAAVPRWSEKGEKIIAKNFCQPVPAAFQIVGNFLFAADIAKFLFFAVMFVVGMSPAVLVAAKQRSIACAALNSLPAPAGDPRRYNGQTERCFMRFEQLYHVEKRSGGNADIVGSEKNLSR